MTMTAVDVTDANFDAEVIERSKQVPVVVDLWAEWCGPCRTLGPIIEKVIDATDGQVVLAKVDVDANPQVSAAFQVQGIPAVYALRDGKVVDGFVGAQPEQNVKAFIDALLPSEADLEMAKLLEAGDEASLRRVLDQQPDHHDAIVRLAELLVAAGESDEALGLLERIPETPETRRITALARTGDVASDDAAATLDSLLDRVKDDEDARQQYIDLLEVLGADDPRTADYRRRLTAKLF
jgi:putative thioredoxin